MWIYAQNDIHRCCLSNVTALQLFSREMYHYPSTLQVWTTLSLPMVKLKIKSITVCGRDVTKYGNIQGWWQHLLGAENVLLSLQSVSLKQKPFCDSDFDEVRPLWGQLVGVIQQDLGSAHAFTLSKKGWRDTHRVSCNYSSGSQDQVTTVKKSLQALYWCFLSSIRFPFFYSSWSKRSTHSS